MLDRAMKDRTSAVIDRKLSLSDPWYQLIIRMLKTVIFEFKGKRILEIGCGFGGFCIFVANTGGYAIGVDISSASIHKAKDLANQMGVKGLTDFVIGDACFLPFKDQSNEIVVCSETLEHIESYEKAFNELVRVTSKLGYLCLTVPNLLSTSFFEFLILLLVGQPQYIKKQACLEKEHVFHIFKLRRLLGKRYLRIIMVQSTDFLHLPPLVRRALKLDHVLRTISTQIEHYSVKHNLPFRFFGANIGVLAQK